MTPLQHTCTISAHTLSHHVNVSLSNATAGEELQAWVQTARELDCLLMMDEFYSHYIYTDDEENGKTVSSAEFVDDVDVDPLIIVDGLTKNWRCPGWRSMRVRG